MVEDYSVHEYDVLVIGAGGAGLRAPLKPVHRAPQLQ